MSLERLPERIVQSAFESVKYIAAPLPEKIVKGGPDSVFQLSTFADAASDTAVRTTEVLAQAGFTIASEIAATTANSVYEVLTFGGKAALTGLAAVPFIPMAKAA